MGHCPFNAPISQQHSIRHITDNNHKNVVLERAFKLTKNDGLNVFDENLLGHARGTVQHDMLHYLSI